MTTRSTSSSTGDTCWGPTAPPTPAGALLARGYEVVAHLRRGRRLDVYDVWSTERGCRCVAKTLRPERGDDATAVAQLRAEGQLLQALTHPHLVRAYETTLTLELPRPVVVTETLTGHTVDFLVAERGRLPARDAAILGMQLCSALGYLHAHGWLHLDVKPANLIAVAGRAVLLDLSLASRIGTTQIGGTFDYLAPEQSHGQPLTAAADVWGIGATLFEALTGAPPFAMHPYGDRRADGSRWSPQSELPAPPIRTRARLPRPIAEIIDACLRFDPAARPTIETTAQSLTSWSGIDPKRFRTIDSRQIC